MLELPQNRTWFWGLKPILYRTQHLLVKLNYMTICVVQYLSRSPFITSMLSGEIKLDSQLYIIVLVAFTTN